MYTMNYFKFLIHFCDELTSLVQNFWWVKIRIRERWFDLVGINFMIQSLVEFWVLNSLKNLIWLS